MEERGQERAQELGDALQRHREALHALARRVCDRVAEAGMCPARVFDIGAGNARYLDALLASTERLWRLESYTAQDVNFPQPTKERRALDLLSRDVQMTLLGGESATDADLPLPHAPTVVMANNCIQHWLRDEGTHAFMLQLRAAMAPRSVLYLVTYDVEALEAQTDAVFVARRDASQDAEAHGVALAYFEHIYAFGRGPFQRELLPRTADLQAWCRRYFSAGSHSALLSECCPEAPGGNSVRVLLASNYFSAEQLRGFVAPPPPRLCMNLFQQRLPAPRRVARRPSRTGRTAARVVSQRRAPASRARGKRYFGKFRVAAERARALKK